MARKITRFQRPCHNLLWLPVLVFFLAASEGSAQEPKISRLTLDNGLQVILKENHSSPMVTSLIFVKAGSKYETPYNNGVTHFLEHLLFDGTTTQTQEQLSRGISRLGGYINAFTQKEMTGYLVLLPKNYIDYGMATQADMLFNSNFPEDKFPKERKIVIDEMKKDNDAEGAAADGFSEEKAMAGTPYARPVLGYESTIANIPREAVIDYWKRFYGPNNMIALIIGDFDTDRMTETVKTIFGKFPKADLPPAPAIEYKRLTGKQIFKTTADSKSTYIDYSIDAPHYTELNYYAFTLLADYLDDAENSPLIAALKNGPTPWAGSVSTSLETVNEFSRLNIRIITEDKNRVDSIIALTDSILAALPTAPPSSELLDGYKTSRRCNEIYMSEKLHYYGFTLAPLLITTGWDFFSSLQSRIDSVTQTEIETAARNYLSAPGYIVTVVSPPTDNETPAFRPTGPTSDDVQAYYRNARFPAVDLTAGKNFRLPEIKPFSPDETRYARYLREVLPNGLTVVIKSNPDSRVFALNVIGKNRSGCEPDGKDGITDFVNHLIEKGTATRPADLLARELASIGANVTLYDNPWIPYDDRYTTRQFSFMKFETIDQFTEKGIDLFSDMITHPAFDSAQIEQVRSEILGLLGRNSGSPYKVARNLFYNTLFAGTPYAKSIEGNFKTISSITRDDLIAHHHRIYAPENMIVTVGTNDDPSKIMAFLKMTLGQLPAEGFTAPEILRPANISGEKPAHQKMEKEQLYLYMGGLLPSAKSPDAPALDVTLAILSERLQNVLREKEGLAYAVGASASFDRNFGWYICSIGTDPANTIRAKNGIIVETMRLKSAPPTDEEVDEAINSIWGSNLTANLSRINQAFYMGVNEYLGLGFDYDDVYFEKIRQVDKGLVMKTARRYLDTENYVISTAGKN